MSGRGTVCLSHVVLGDYIINPRPMCRRATVVGSVYVSVKSHLTSGTFENTVTYSAGNRGQNVGVNISLKPLHCRVIDKMDMGRNVRTVTTHTSFM